MFSIPIKRSFGRLDLAIPQVSGGSEIFHASLLEKGSRSGRALKSTLATMYVQGVSTRHAASVKEMDPVAKAELIAELRSSKVGEKRKV